MLTPLPRGQLNELVTGTHVVAYSYRVVLDWLSADVADLTVRLLILERLEDDARGDEDASDLARPVRVRMRVGGSNTRCERTDGGGSSLRLR